MIKNKKLLIYILAFSIWSVFVFKLFQGGVNSKKADETFYKKFNEYINGKILKIEYYDPGIGKRNTYKFVYVKLYESTIKTFDIRDSSKKGFFIIKKDSAILVLNSGQTRKMLPGDWLLFDGDVDTLYHYRILKFDYNIYPDDEIINLPYKEATKLLPENAKVITKWQPKRIIHGTRYSIAKKIKGF